MASCTNSPGSFQCTCNPGYTGDGLHCYSNATLPNSHLILMLPLSSDVNECLDTPGPCASNAVCTDSEGSFSCSCQPGYSGNGYQNCSSKCSDMTISAPCSLSLIFILM